MEHIKTQIIENVGVVEYYLTKTLNKDENETITTYGVAVKDINENCTETVDDIWTERDKVVDFINLLAENQVTCIHLNQLCEEFAEELYSM